MRMRRAPGLDQAVAIHPRVQQFPGMTELSILEPDWRAITLWTVAEHDALGLPCTDRTPQA